MSGSVFAIAWTTTARRALTRFPDTTQEVPLMDERFEVTVGAGTIMSGPEAAVCFPHRWTPDGAEVRRIS